MSAAHNADSEKEGLPIPLLLSHEQEAPDHDDNNCRPPHSFRSRNKDQGL